MLTPPLKNGSHILHDAGAKSILIKSSQRGSFLFLSNFQIIVSGAVDDCFFQFYASICLVLINKC